MKRHHESVSFSSKWMKRDYSSDESPDMEYELTELSGPENDLFSTSEESELQEITELGAVVAAVAYDDSSLEDLFADKSEENPTSPTSNSDVDPGLPRTDYLDFHMCLLCKTDKKDISYPYCTKCFDYKKNLFPPRPNKGKKKKSSPVVKYSESKDSPVTSQESRTDIISQESTTDSISQSTDCVDGQTSSRVDSSFSSSKDKNICNVCLQQPINSVFAHGGSCHLYSCYSCSIKTWKSIGACPLCRKKVYNVLKMLNY